jgi:hypothetical protein
MTPEEVDAAGKKTIAYTPPRADVSVKAFHGARVSFSGRQERRRGDSDSI